MNTYRKLIVAGAIAAVLTGGAGAAMAASDGSGHHSADQGRRTASYTAPHSSGSAEKGTSTSTKDDGKPGLSRNGTPAR